MILDESRFFSEDELFASRGCMLVDVESYPNYFLVSFLHYETKKIAYFELHEQGEPFASEWVKWIVNNFCIVGFNNDDYDNKMICAAIAGCSVGDLKKMSDEIIRDNARTADLELKYDFEMIRFNSVDLIEVAPLQASLKTYGARLHAPHIEDLPYDIETFLTREEKNHVRQYNFNDLELSYLLLKELEPSLELRAALGAEFGRDLRSLSDAQLAQEIITGELTRILGKKPKKPDFKKDFVGMKFSYVAPSYIAFHDPMLQQMLLDIQAAEIEVGATGHVICPKSIQGRKIVIDVNAYKIGMGGLHSREQTQALVATSELRILDRDVTGYYPNLILKNGFAPIRLGKAFLEALQNIVDRRYAAKKSGDKKTADSLKIAANGSFGKLSDPYSPIYDPTMMVQTTLTGQLSLLMVIEWLTRNGIKVMSANTDGIVCIIHPSQYELFVSIFKAWEERTSLETEETEYAALYSRDVSNYLAFKLDGSSKAKGVYAEVGSALNSPLSKNPSAFVCVDAVKALIGKGTPIEDTIRNCKNFTRFVSVNKVTGGAHKDGHYLGKTVRWYYANGIVGAINIVTNNHTVPTTEGGKPCMDLPASFPDDINYDWYLNQTTRILEDIGFQMKRNQQLTLI